MQRIAVSEGEHGNMGSLVDGARQRMRLVGMTDAQIARVGYVEQSRTPHHARRADFRCHRRTRVREARPSRAACRWSASTACRTYGLRRTARGAGREARPWKPGRGEGSRWYGPDQQGRRSAARGQCTDPHAQGAHRSRQRLTPPLARHVRDLASNHRRRTTCCWTHRSHHRDRHAHDRHARQGPGAIRAH